MYLCDTWYLSLCVDDCLVCGWNSNLHTRQLPIQYDKYQVSHISPDDKTQSHPKHVEKRNKHTKKNVTNTRCPIHTIISPDDRHIVARNMQRKEINILRKMCTKLALFARLCRDERSTKHKKHKTKKKFQEIIMIIIYYNYYYVKFVFTISSINILFYQD